MYCQFMKSPTFLDLVIALYIGTHLGIEKHIGEKKKKKRNY